MKCPKVSNKVTQPKIRGFFFKLSKCRIHGCLNKLKWKDAVTFSKMTLSIMPFSIKTFNIMTLSIMTVSIKGLFVTLEHTWYSANKALSLTKFIIMIVTFYLLLC